MIIRHALKVLLLVFISYMTQVINNRFVLPCQQAIYLKTILKTWSVKPFKPFKAILRKFLIIIVEDFIHTVCHIHEISLLSSTSVEGLIYSCPSSVIIHMRWTI